MILNQRGIPNVIKETREKEARTKEIQLVLMWHRICITVSAINKLQRRDYILQRMQQMSIFQYRQHA